MPWALINRIADDLTPGGVGIWLLLVLALWYVASQRIADRKLSIEDRQANREGFSAQVKHLTEQLTLVRAENRSLLDDQTKLRAEYREDRRRCDEETERLRDEIERLRVLVEKHRSLHATFREVLSQFPANERITALLLQLDGLG